MTNSQLTNNQIEVNAFILSARNVEITVKSTGEVKSKSVVSLALYKKNGDACDPIKVWGAPFELTKFKGPGEYQIKMLLGSYNGVVQLEMVDFAE